MAHASGAGFGVALGCYGLWNIRFDDEGGWYLLLCGLFLVFYCGYLGIRVALALITGTIRLTLDAEGFAVRYPLHSGREEWNSATDFSVQTRSNGLFLVYRDGRRAKWWELTRRIWFSGRAWLPHTFGLGKGLADLMTAWRERALAQTPRRTVQASTVSG